MDIDGTVCVGPDAIDGAADAVSYIHGKGIRLIFFTNDSSRSREQIAKRLVDAGIGCSSDDVMSSGFMAAQYVHDHSYEGVFVSGTEGLKEEFGIQGIELVDPSDAKTLIVGMDFNIDYAKLKVAINAALNAERIIICNRDRIFKCSQDAVCPGCGAIVSAIEYCASKDADVMVGKPEPYMIEHVCKTLNVNKSEVLVVGDNYESDIRMGQDNGALTFQVGISEGSVNTIKDLPDYVDSILSE